METGGEGVKWAVPHSLVVNKNQEGYHGSERSNPNPRPDHTTQSSSTRKLDPHNFWLRKPLGVGAAEETADLQEDLLKEPAWT